MPLPLVGPRARAHCELLAMVADARGHRDPTSALQRLENLLNHVTTISEADRTILLWGQDPQDGPIR